MASVQLKGAPAASSTQPTPSPTFTAADRAAHAASSFVRSPLDRNSVISSAIARLESGTATVQSGQDPVSLADEIREGAESDSSARRFAAFKLAQRVGGAR